MSDIPLMNCIPFHCWSKWSDKTVGTEMQGAVDTNLPVIVQERRCIRCNAVQLRTARTSR